MSVVVLLFCLNCTSWRNHDVTSVGPLQKSISVYVKCDRCHHSHRAGFQQREYIRTCDVSQQLKVK